MGEDYKIYLGNKVTSSVIQAELFALGYVWATSGSELQAYDRCWVKISLRLGVIFIGSVTNEVEVTLFDLFEANEKLALPKPAKEMTVSEISDELGYEVKVIK